VPDYGDCRVADVDASPQACFDALTDFEHLPEWQGAVRQVRVLERDERGRGTVSEFEVDARIRRVRYACVRSRTCRARRETRSSRATNAGFRHVVLSLPAPYPASGC